MKRNCVGAAGPLLEGGDLRAKSAGATGPDNQNLMGLISPSWLKTFVIASRADERFP